VGFRRTAGRSKSRPSSGEGFCSDSRLGFGGGPALGRFRPLLRDNGARFPGGGQFDRTQRLELPLALVLVGIAMLSYVYFLAQKQ
jgi:hypothetical protein